MFASIVASALAFSGPSVNAPRTSRAAVQMAPTLDTLPGKYALGGVFDPLGLGEKGDLIWLREAELKHGRLCMLAVVGYIAVDNGIHFPAPQFEGLSSLAAHDAAVKSGAMQGLFGTVAILEVLDSIRLFPAMSKGWADHKIGSFSLDPLSMANERTTLAEIKNGRLAMMAFSGLVTQSALTGHGFPYM